MESNRQWTQPEITRCYLWCNRTLKHSRVWSGFLKESNGQRSVINTPTVNKLLTNLK